jgi:2-oxoisovalerate/pyruvate ferredoxin oxidoreductase gamma subunit
MNTQITGIRWHGRGGQGAITAAKIVAQAAFASGYGGVVMAPSFGTERRGAPVLTSLKISRQKIYDLTAIEEPDIVVVLDHLLLDEADVLGGLRAGGRIVLNTPHPLETYSVNGNSLAVADVTALSVKAGLTHGMVNAGIIGLLARYIPAIPFELLLSCIETEFRDRKPQANAQAAKLVYEKALLKGLR